MSTRSGIILRLLLAGLLLFSLAACSQKAATQSTPAYKISGLITQTHAYCGGIRPPADLLNQLNTPQPFPGKKLFIRSGKENVIDQKIMSEFIPDSGGHFSVQLPSGTYCIIQEEQVKDLDIPAFRKKLPANLKLDEACLKQWWGKSLMTFEVASSDKNDLRLNFHIPCFTEGLPCVSYTGPMPQ
jgi:hypothetical protein